MAETFEKQFMAHNTSEKYPEDVVSVTQENNCCFFLKCENKVLLQLVFCSKDIVRFRYSTKGYFQKDFSYAIDEQTPFKMLDVIQLNEEDDAYVFDTGSILVHIKKVDLSVKITNCEGEIICNDEKGFHWEQGGSYGADIIMMSKEVQSGEYYFGLGDKSCEMNLRGRRFSVWGTDTYGYGKESDPLYKNIPFYYGIHHQRAYGIFFDNSHKTHFDFGHERTDVTSFWAHGGEMNYYFINGPELMSVAEKYTLLTGVPELPPMWALAYHQCKWSYYPESNVREICDGFRERKIPCDAIYLDIDYMDGFRCFTWDKDKFPAPTKMIQELSDEGFKTVVIIDPGIKVDDQYTVWKDGLSQDIFCKRLDGELMEAPVWPGACSFPDFTNPKARAWWADLFDGLIAENGIRGVWNDMNEPAVFKEDNFTQGDRTFPDDVRHDYDGNPSGHTRGHNVYGMQMARATYDGVKKYAYPNRPFVITRSGYSGVQRYSSGWTGDNVATWEHLWIANMQCQRLSISGMSFVGSDIGGFIDTPNGEMFIRWLQLGVFHVFFRTHSSGDHGDQEPWSFGEPYTSLARKFIELRYTLLPYIYTAFWQHIKFGTPMLRPLSFVDQTDNETLHRMEEFMVGDNLLVSPIGQAEAKGRWVYLPKGDWYYYWDDSSVESQTEVWANAPLDRIPMYVRAGAVIPKYPVMQYVGERVIEELSLNVYYIEGDKESVYYEDGGEGYAYQEGNFALRTYKVTGEQNSLVIHQSLEGEYQPSWKRVKVILHSLPFDPSGIFVDGQEVEFVKRSRTGRDLYVVKAIEGFTTIDIK